MKKKLGIWLITVLLFIQSMIPVHAAPDENTVIESVSGYCLGDELYTFLRIDDGYDVSGFKVSLQSDEISAVSDESMLPITETSSIVRYVFMVDLTGSMRKYVEEVNEFVNALTEAEKQEVFYTVATFGECFQIVRENLTDKNAVTNVISGLEYTEQLTDPYTGIESALVYLDNYSRRSGDLVNLIVITDGDPDLGIADEEQSKKKEESLAESAEIKIAHTPEVVISTLCTNEWDKLAYETVSKGKGIHEVIHGNKEASAAGKKLAGYVDGLYRNSFQLSKTPNEERFAMELKIKGNNQEGQLAFFSVSMENVADLKSFSNDGEPEENTLIIEENAPEVKEESSEDNLTDTQEDSEMEEDVVTSQWSMQYMNRESHLVHTHVDEKEDGVIVIEDFFYEGCDIRVKLNTEDRLNPTAELYGAQVVGSTGEAFGTIYGNGKLMVDNVEGYLSYYSTCENFLVIYTLMYVEEVGMVGAYVNILEWVSDDEAERIMREGI